jgi:serine/threonine protein kinase
MSERSIFLSAIEIADPIQRAAYVEQACGGDAALKAEVEALLDAHEQTTKFLETPAVTEGLAVERTVIKQFADEGEDQDAGAPAGEAEIRKYLEPPTKPGWLGRLGHYEIEEILGRGAFGIVAKAFDEKLHRVVAIKLLSPGLAATSPPRKRFLREARTAAAVRHENIVGIHAIEEEPLPYLVMEYIPGETLQHRLDEQGPLEVLEILQIGQQVAAGLAAAHAVNLIHRDIKPSNILLEKGTENRVKISDFGLARAVDDASLSSSGMVAGTPMYMAPEQALGESLDHRADLFSLGSVLYQMASGRPPFRAGTTVAVLKRICEDVPRPIEDVIPGTPDWLCAIISKLHAKKREDRFQSAKEVADLLAGCLAALQSNRPIELPGHISLPEKQSARSDTSMSSPKALDSTAEINLGRLQLTSPTTQSLHTNRRWTGLAAALLLVIVSLSITEATGVTKLASTVIRLTTGSGTLIIETDDPGIQVTIDGEEVQIEGAGVEQLTLKPGHYQIAALKDGKPVSQQLVTITRGGREVVRVTLNPVGEFAANRSIDNQPAPIWKPTAEQQAFFDAVAKLPTRRAGRSGSQKADGSKPRF